MTSSSRFRRPFVPLAAGGVALALALVGCGPDTATENPSAPTAEAGAATPEVSVALADGWVKAADTGMTAVFGTLTNRGDLMAYYNRKWLAARAVAGVLKAAA